MYNVICVLLFFHTFKTNNIFSSLNDLNMAIQGIFYKTVARRFSTLLLACAAGAYVFDLTFNTATNAYWDAVSLYL